MQLPDNVRRVIAERADAIGFAALKRAADAMSDAYRSGRPTRIDPDAYLVTRMPATYSAAMSALREVHERIGPIESVLDVGAGTGGASLAARSYFPSAAINMIERQSVLSDIARSWLPDARITTADATQILALPPHDLVIAAYALGEFGTHLADRLWQAARVALVVIEPGTPQGFALIRDVRAELLNRGAYMAAPCPSAMPCPVVSPDWCHFAARVERSSLHRRLKDADLGYEDEKFSYVALSRQPVKVAPARVVRRPHHHPGFIVLETCTPEGLRTERVTKRDRDAFREARKAGWGSAIYHSHDESGTSVGPSV